MCGETFNKFQVGHDLYLSIKTREKLIDCTDIYGKIYLFCVWFSFRFFLGFVRIFYHDFFWIFFSFGGKLIFTISSNVFSDQKQWNQQFVVKLFLLQWIGGLPKKRFSRKIRSNKKKLGGAEQIHSDSSLTHRHLYQVFPTSRTFGNQLQRAANIHGKSFATQWL